MLKKSSLISAYTTLQCCNIHTSTSTTSPSLPSCQRARPTTHHNRRPQWRSYATVRDNKGPDFRDNMNWPCRKAKPTQPTPYEIFDIERGGTYTKRKYYELVKLYHPDKSSHHHDSKQLTHLERLERYRLVVQAHEILSDPAKRKAYDAYGAGWGDRNTTTRHSRGYTNSHGQEYGHGTNQDASPFSNATWEDWERWYRQREPHQKQTYAGTYVNHNAFASFVILMAVLTGIIQATRAGQYSASLGEKAQAFTEETNQFLTTRAQQFNENKLDSGGRVKHFLQKRDPSRYGLKDEEESTYRKHFAGTGHLPEGKEKKVEAS